MIPTASQFILENLVQSSYEADGNISAYDVEELMIKFSKIHVELALKEAAEKALLEQENYKGKWTDAEISIDNYTYARVNKDSILNAYPLTNIK